MKKKNLILILAREGSTNMARQNLRLVNHKPLIFYVIKNALNAKIGDVYVSSDSEEIREVAKLYGAMAIARPRSLTKNSSSYEEISFHTLSTLKKSHLNYQKCLLISPIFPLLKPTTIKKFFATIGGNIKTVNGFVIDRKEDYRKYRLVKRKITFSAKKKTKITTLTKIVGFDCTNFLKTKKFMGPLFGIRLSSEEVPKIHNYHDLLVISEKLKRRKILVRVDADNTIGLGHVYNILTVMNHFRNDEMLIVMNSKKTLANNKFKEQNYDLKYFTRNVQLKNILKQFKPNIIINDILNTNKKYMTELKKEGCFIVNFEDVGAGSNYANLVFNPIYHSNEKSQNKFFGSKYACIRDEFLLWKNSNSGNNKVILITFGGSDPRNLTTKVLNTIYNSEIKQFKIVVILGFSFSKNLHIKNLVSKMKKTGFNLQVIEKSYLMAKHVSEADFVITANGRTVFEVASLNIPFITISANTREEKHPFSRYSKGGIHLGLYSGLTDQKILDAIKKMSHSHIRKRFFKNLEKFDLLNGINEVVKLINSNYEQWNMKKFR